ncbi:hypothetical protein SAMN05443431_105283 [Olleya namhaensis]|uniref:Uncharacterized protein n=1 Tax=Olleya namhaensis TaxID=1144750 RepID=A0A1I3PU79_9FLAO|nr:hypothetical protein SAMN05443431_105283 [Olleya namhaensis]
MDVITNPLNYKIMLTLAKMIIDILTSVIL